MYDTCTMTNRLGAAVGSNLRKAPHLCLRALLLLSVFGGYRGIAAAAAEVGLWPLNAQFGASDITGNGNDGTATGTQLAPGPYGDADGAFLFSGNANSYIAISNNGRLDVRYSFTILAHIYPTGQTGPIFDYSGNNNWALHLWQSSPTTLLMQPIGRDGYFSSHIRADVLQQSAWNYVGTTYNNNTGMASLWNNGELVNEAHIGVAEVASQYPVRVGVRDGDNRYFAGRIACLQLYNYAMTQEQIAAMRDACKGPPWSASSQFDTVHSADRADINTRETAYKAGAWAARTNDVDQWLMRDLGEVKVVTGIITKGRNYSPDWPHVPHDQYVTSYVISYGIENGDEQFYTNATNETIVFTGNQDRDTEVFNDFLAYSGSIKARFVKIHPRTWHEHISMRAKVVTFDVNCEMGEFGHLSFPGADGGAFSYSDERCNSSAANGKPLASRFCRIVAVRGALWDKPVNLTCDINLQNLSQVEVNNESALSVATDLQVLTMQADTISSNDVTIISKIVQDIVNASATEEIGDSLLTTVDNLINVNVTILHQSQQETRGPTRVVQALETFADTVVLTTEKYTVVRPSVALQAADISPEELDKGQGFAFFLGGNDSNSLKEGNVSSFTWKDSRDFQQTADISILLPANISNMIQISDSSGTFTGGEVRLSYTLYSSSSLFVQTSQDAVGTRIIGGRIAGRRVQNLPEPVIITFTPLQDYAKEGRCVFWDFEAKAGQGAWSTEGCESRGEENGRYRCACNHLTNFAVLFNVHGGVFGDHEKPLEVITAVGCVVSIVCLILTLLSFVLTRKSKRGSRTGRHAKNQQLVLINLCVALLAILVIFLVGVNRTASPIGCTAVAALLHYFLLAALVWMAVEAVSIYRAVVLVFDHHVSGNFVIKAAAVAWGFPLVVTASTAGPSSLYKYKMAKFCWLAHKPLIYAFLLPVGLILLFNLLVFVIVMYKLVRNEEGRKELTASGDKPNEADRSWIARQIRRAFSIMALLGLTWVFGFFVISDASPVFAYLFCIFNTLQGLYIFVFHCAVREDMAKWWQKINCITGKWKRGRYQVAKGDTPFSPAAETPETIALNNV